MSLRISSVIALARRMTLHRFSIVVACLTFLLLLLGGLVHNTRSSLACPDWPLCYGQIFPHMVGHVLVEHSHRLVATTVGLCTIGLLVGLWLRAQRTGETGLIALGIGALACVIFQGVLGGLTVIYRLPTWISTTHLGVSMIFFSITIYIAFRTREPRVREPLAPSVRRLTLIAGLAVYAQMVLGALMRHLGVGLACIDWPLCHGELFPGGNPYLTVHMLHRLVGVIVFVIVTAAAIVTARNARGSTAVRTLAIAAPILALVQITLGVLSITLLLDVIPVTAHLGVAAALLADFVCLHLIARGEPSARSPVAHTVEPYREVLA